MNAVSENSSPDLSVIIAVYNVEDWLPSCLDSVLAQDLPASRFEVILVDDGSTDRSAAICREYARGHANVTLLSLPRNTPGGVGIPANKGMAEARGTYIGFVDSDDFAHPSMFSVLLKEALAAEADLALCDFAIRYELAGETRPAYDHKDWKRLFSPDFRQLPLVEQKRCYLRLSPAPWRKIYRREFLRGHNIRFPEGDFFCEDNPFHWRAVILAERIVQVDEALITHRYQRAGQTTAPDMADRCGDMLRHLIDIRTFLREQKIYGEYEATFRDFMVFILYMIRARLPEHADLAHELLGPVDLKGLFADSRRG